MATQKAVDLGTKISIIRDLENGKKQTKIAEELHFPRSTIQTIWSCRKKIFDNYVAAGPTPKKLSTTKFPKPDAALVDWFDVQRGRKLPINGPFMLTKAKMFSSAVGENDFNASNGWLDRWKKRHGIV